jgi:hypothetical protein
MKFGVALITAWPLVLLSAALAQPATPGSGTAAPALPAATTSSPPAAARAPGFVRQGTPEVRIEVLGR